MSEEQPGARGPTDGFREGVRTVTGVLGALVEALEKTFDDLREGGDLAPERAREVARTAVLRAQETVEDLRGRLEFVPRREFDALRDEVAALRQAIEQLQGNAGSAGEPAATRTSNPSPPRDFPVDSGG
jgi:polyhydroxyalkanoate synthesis regulator phasin